MTALNRYNDTQGHQKEIRLHEAVRELFIIARFTQRKLYYCSSCGNLEISEREQVECSKCFNSNNIGEITKDDQRFDVTRKLIRNQENGQDKA